MKNIFNDREFIIYAKKTIIKFYENFEKLTFENTNDKKILNLKNLAPNLLEEENITKSKFVNYIKKMKRLNNNTEKYNINTEEEKFILFMFSVDPTFEAIKIYGECNNINQVKQKMGSFFGLYDSKLITIEKKFIKNFFSEKEKEVINDEIEKRVYK